MKLQKAVGLVAAFALLAGISTLAVVRGRQPLPAQHGLAVAATYYPLYEFAKQVGGSEVMVTNITPAGAEPHDYEPSPQTLARVQQADVFIYNGGRMEPWVLNFIRSYDHLAVKASSGLNLLPGVSQNGTPQPGAQDPHFWLDPVDAQTIVATIRDAFSKADPAHAVVFQRNAAAYIAQLQQLDHDYRVGLATCRTRTIVTSHAAFSYLAKRYSIAVVPIAGINPDDEPSAAKLAEVTRIVAQKDIRYIFFEKLVSPRLAATIAHETGAQTAIFDPIEGLDEHAQKSGHNYLTIQHDNLGALRAALACQ